MDLNEYLKGGKVMVWKEKFAVVKASTEMPGAFLTMHDHQETTVIIEESKVDKDKVVEIQKGYRMLTFKMLMPFGVVGFFEKVGKAFAKKEISILSYAAYSSDHILVEEHVLDKTLEALKELGLEIVE